MPLTFRSAVQDDICEILRLYAEAGLDEGATLPREQVDVILQRIQVDERLQIFVADLNGAIVGTVSLMTMGNLGHGGAPCGFVEDVAIDQTLRGRGYGRARMDFASDRCWDAGCFTLTLSSRLKPERAHRFYESLGYRKHGYSFFLDLRSAR